MNTSRKICLIVGLFVCIILIACDTVENDTHNLRVHSKVGSCLKSETTTAKKHAVGVRKDPIGWIVSRDSDSIYVICELQLNCAGTYAVSGELVNDSTIKLNMQHEGETALCMCLRRISVGISGKSGSLLQVRYAVLDGQHTFLADSTK